MDPVPVFAGPIRGLSTRRRLQETVFDICQPCRFVNPEDIDKVIQIDKDVSADTSVASGSVADDDIKTRRICVAQNRPKAKKLAAEARASGLLEKSINGTGMKYAWVTKSVDKLPANGPSEPAGPLQPGSSITISNTLGNIIGYECNGTSQFWILGYDGAGSPVWLAAEDGQSHPDTENLSGYGLTTRNPSRPSWVKIGTIERYRYPSMTKVARD